MNAQPQRQPRRRRKHSISRFVTSLLAIAIASGELNAQTPERLSLSAATSTALQRVSLYQQAQIDEQLAAEDLAQARAALLPRIRDAFTVTYNSPAHRPQGGVDPTSPAFIAANAVHEYQNLFGVTGDLSYGLFAAVTRSRAALRAAR